MKFLHGVLLILRLRRLTLSFSQKRFKYKQKWAFNEGRKEPQQMALHHFDLYYQPVFKDLWHSIRVSLLSMQKYGVLLNNYSHKGNDTRWQLTADLLDVIKLAEQTEIHDYAKKFDVTRLINEVTKESCNGDVKRQDRDENLDSQVKTDISSGLLADHEDLDSFMPPTRVYSEKEQVEMEEISQSVYEPRDIRVDVVPETDFSLPTNLRMGVFGAGVIRDFPAPKVDPGGLLPYYLMDASSILPVIALAIKPDDKVLDLCAAPGGKTLAILQSLLTDNLTCNDISYSRLGRLFDILRNYLPSVPTTLNTIKRNGALFTEPLFDKVLVDVPCNTDRHVLSDQEQNLFLPSRQRERLRIPQLQRNLLVAGIKSCHPGGCVVYSTCTLSPAQNDGTIQAAIEDIWKNTDIDVSVVDTSWIAEKFRKTFKFHKHSRFGQLVLPTLTNNFGPTYFCKIKRN